MTVKKLATMIFARTSCKQIKLTFCLLSLTTFLISQVFRVGETSRRHAWVQDVAHV